MNINTVLQKTKYGLEIIRWCIVGILLGIAIIGNYIYHDVNLTFRAIIIAIIIAIAGAIAMMTSKGRYILTFAREARTEVRKVIWPTRQETLHTTFIVAAVTIVTSLVLWGLDSILVRAVLFITSLRF